MKSNGKFLIVVVSSFFQEYHEIEQEARGKSKDYEFFANNL
jgi:hypothetical protein